MQKSSNKAERHRGENAEQPHQVHPIVVPYAIAARVTAFRSTQTSIVEDLKNLLRDRYRSGFPVFKELLQNADDARAKRLVIKGHPGFAEALNPLLRAPCLIVANDGRVELDHFEAMERASGGSKAGDAGTVGRFGLGQKAVFHLCDAFVAQAWIGNAATSPEQKIMNPWEAIPGATNAGGDWKTVHEGDRTLLQEWFAANGFGRQGLMLVLPLRTDTFSPGGGYALTEARWTLDTALAEISGSDELTTALCCIRNLATVVIDDPAAGEVHYEIDASVGRLSTATIRRGAGAIGGVILRANSPKVRFVGREHWFDGGVADALRHESSWPHSFDLAEQRHPQKAEPHGAVLMCRGDLDPKAVLRIHWAVFLPVQGGAETLPLPVGLGTIDLLLHGYFFVDSARTTIGFGEDGADRIEERWNRALRDETTLPLVLDVLADGLSRLLTTDADRESLVAAIGHGSKWLDQYRIQICGTRALANAWDGAATQSWRIAPSRVLRPVPRGPGINLELLERSFPGLAAWCRERGLSLAFGSQISTDPQRWADEELASLIGLAGPTIFQRAASADLVATLLTTLGGIGPQVSAALAGALRAALVDSTIAIRATDQALRRIVGALPPEQVFELPRTVKNRPIMRALAEAGELIPVRSDWWEGGSARLSSTAAIDLLTALIPFIGNATAGEEAAATVSQILKSGPGLPELAANSRASNLAIIPAVRVYDRADVTLTIGQAVSLGEGGLLFHALPNRLLDQFADAVIEPFVYRVKWPAEGAGPTLQVATPRTVARALQSAIHYGEPAARGVLAAQLGDAAEAGVLRALCAAMPDLSRDARLYELDRLPPALAGLVDLLRAGRASDVLIDPAVAGPLSAVDKERLSIERLDADQLGRWILDAHRAGTLPGLADTVAQTLLTSEISRDVLVSLPLHLDRDGTRVAANDQLYQARSGEVPASLVPLVHVLVPWRDDRVEQAQRNMVPRWSMDTQLAIALASSSPWEHLQAIVSALTSPGIDIARHVRALRSAPWLPIDLAGTPPTDVLDLAPSVDVALRSLLGPVGKMATRADLPLAVRGPAILTVLQDNAILPGRGESLQRAAQMVAAAGEIGCIVDPARHLEDLQLLARHDAALRLPAWALLKEVLKGDDERAGKQGFAAALVAAPSREQVREHLNALAALATVGQVGEKARTLHQAVFTAHVAWTLNEGFLPADLAVPTVLGAFMPAEEVAFSASGVDRGFLLAREYASVIEGEGDRVLLGAAGSSTSSHQRFIADLGARLEPWRHHVPGDAVLFLLALLGRGSAMEALAQRWEQQRSFQRICDDLDALQSSLEILTPVAQRLEEIEFEIADNIGRHAEVLSAAGTPCIVPLDGGGTAWLVDVVRLPTHRHDLGAPLRHPYRLSLAEVNVTDEASIQGYFEQFVDKLAPVLGVLFGAKRAILTNAVAACFETDQAALAETESELQRVLDDRLRSLKVKGSVKAALNDFDRCQHRDRQAGRRLWDFVRTQAAAPEMLAAVRAKILEMGYSDDRILFELFQNADDALRHWTGPANPRFRVEISRSPEGAITNLRVIHWGRPINHLGQDREAGLENDYHRDLASMLAIGQSGKAGDEQTGRFGLGFKTVHMLSDTPGIASGRIAARINGGMVPVSWDRGRSEAGRHSRLGEIPTLIDLPIPPERAPAAARAVGAFVAAANWLPVIAPRLRCIEISENDVDEPVLASTGIELADGVDLVTMRGGRRAVRLDLSAGFRLFIGLGAAGPEGIRDVRSLWHLVPLDEEERHSDWLLEGRFRVNPGRTHIIGSLEDKVHQFAVLADSLGQRLLSLFDAVEADWEAFSTAQGMASDGRSAFWTKLVDLLARDLGAEPAAALHRAGGLATLLSARPLVPLADGGLVTASAVAWRRAGALADPDIFAQVQSWPAFMNIAGSVVDQLRADLLHALGLGLPNPLTLTALVQRMVDGGSISPANAEALGTVISADAFLAFPFEERLSLLQFLRTATFLAEDGSAQPIVQLSFPHGTGAEEQGRAAFAPGSGRLAVEYQGAGLELAELARREAGHNQYIWRYWVRAAVDPAIQEAFLRFLLLTDRNMAQYLYSEAPWAPGLGQLPQSPLLHDWSADQRGYLMAQLGSFAAAFPDASEDDDAEWSSPDPTMALEAIADWWGENMVELRSRHLQATYPENFSPLDLAASPDDARWFTMFALATFQTLGRIKPEQSRSFVGRGIDAGWWLDLAQAHPDHDTQPWIERMQAWSEPWEETEFLTWRRCLVDLYAIVRYLRDYRRIFLRLPQILEQEGDAALRDLLTPATSQIVSNMGIVAAPLARSFGLGANWTIRELLRYGAYGNGPHPDLEPFGWSTTRRVRTLFRRLGADPEHGPDHGRYLFDYTADRIGAERARFLGDMDLPLQLITTSRHRDVLSQILSDANIQYDGFDFEDDDV